MARTKHAVARHRRKQRLLKETKGYWQDRSKRFVHAKQALMKALVYSYRDRRVRKREFRKLWIARINAACREQGISYSRFIKGLSSAKIQLNRKILADLAAQHARVFKKLVEIAKS